MTAISANYIPSTAPASRSTQQCNMHDTPAGKACTSSSAPGHAPLYGRNKTLNMAHGNESPAEQEFTPEELRQIRELQSRDREVHAHEQAHIAAGGRYVRSGASYSYQTGPDGRRYAVGGEVSIDTSEENNPKATIRKMETVRKAALAPARPSAKDRAVAAQAQRKLFEAEAELAEQQREYGTDRGSSLETGTVVNIYA